MYTHLRKHLRTALVVGLAAAAAALVVAGDRGGGQAAAAGGEPSPSAPTPGPDELPEFNEPGEIDNRYLPLTEFSRCVISGEADDGTKERSVRTLLERTKPFEIGGQRVEAAIILDRAFADGELVERTLDYFAQGDDGAVYYLGENVDNIENGVVVDHDGTWLYGHDTDVLGVAMPADPHLGQQYRFEDVPGVTIESNRVEELGLRADVAGERLEDVIRISEFIQPEGDIEHKLYAPDLGLIAEYPPDGSTELVGCS